MLRPIEKIYDVPAVINSKKSRRKLKNLKGFVLLEDCDRQILEEKEAALNRHRICINELQERFRTMQGEIREKKQQIQQLESGQIEGKFSTYSIGCHNLPTTLSPLFFEKRTKFLCVAT